MYVPSLLSYANTNSHLTLECYHITQADSPEATVLLTPVHLNHQTQGKGFMAEMTQFNGSPYD